MKRSFIFLEHPNGSLFYFDTPSGAGLIPVLQIGESSNMLRELIEERFSIKVNFKKVLNLTYEQFEKLTLMALPKNRDYNFVYEFDIGKENAICGYSKEYSHLLEDLLVNR